MHIARSQLKVAGIAAGVTCLLFSSGFLVFFTPFPLYFVTTVYGRVARKVTIIITLAAALVFYLLLLPLMQNLAGEWGMAGLIFLLPGAGLAKAFNITSAQYFGLFYMAYFLLFGYLFSEGMIKKWSLTRWFAIPVFAAFALLVMAALLPGLAGVSVLDGMHQYMKSILDEMISAQEAAGLAGERIFAIKQNADDIINFSLSIIPSVVFLLGLMVAAANQVLARWMIKKPERFAHFGDISRFSVPQHLVWITIMLGFLFYADRYFFNSRIVSVVTLNCLIVCGGIYFLQGLIIVSFHLSRLHGRWLKTSIYLSIFFFIQATAPALIIIGFTDLWIDFRRLIRKEGKVTNKRRDLPWK